MTEINVKAVIGKDPNEVFLRTGQALVILSAITYFGISGFGVELGDRSELAPLVGGSFGALLMVYGAYLRKGHLIAKEKHDIAMAKLGKKGAK